MGRTSINSTSSSRALFLTRFLDLQRVLSLVLDYFTRYYVNLSDCDTLFFLRRALQGSNGPCHPRDDEV